MEPTIRVGSRKRGKVAIRQLPARSRIKKPEEDFIKMLKSLSKLFISSTLLCAMIILNAQGQHARSLRTPSGPSAGTNAILCQPGLVFRCNQFGCFCVKP